MRRSLIPNSEPTSWISKATSALAGFLAWASIVATTLDAARLGRRLCSEGCETVRESQASKAFEKAFGGLRIADLGLIFFLGSLSALALGALSGTLAGLMPILAGLSAVASIGSLYLVDLQLRRLRAWCPLCMAVHAVVWAQTVLLFASSGASGPTPADAALALFAFGWPALTVAAALPTLRASAKHGRERLAHLRLRRRPSVVRALLAESPRLQLPPAREGGRMGSPAAPAQLDLFETPGCRRCEERLAEARELLDRFPERLSVVVHTLDGEAESPSCAATRWLEEHKIRGVSPVFLDGRQLPESLEVQDLQFFVRRVEMTV